MRFRCEVVVRLKPGLADPQGRAIEGALPALGWVDVSGVRVGRVVEFDVQAPDEAAARARAEDLGRGLLANPVIESFRVEAVSPA